MDGGPGETGTALERDLRRFLAAEIGRGGFDPRAGSFAGFDAGFAGRLGAHGFIGTGWPRGLGGMGGGAADRAVIAAALLAHGAPLRAHWVAEWLAGPLLLRAGSAAQQRELLPRIAAGRLSLCIGLAEAAPGPGGGMPDGAGPCRAVPVGDGWRISGRKGPVADAAQAQRMILLARTAPPAQDGPAGITLFLVDLALPGIALEPWPEAAGAAAVVLDDVFVAADRVIGTVDAGLEAWQAAAGAALAVPDGAVRGYLRLAGLLDGGAVAAAGGSGQDARPRGESAP